MAYKLKQTKLNENTEFANKLNQMKFGLITTDVECSWLFKWWETEGVDEVAWELFSEVIFE